MPGKKKAPHKDSIQALKQEVAALKKANQQLAGYNGGLLKSVFDSVQDGISILNPDLTIVRVNGLMKEWYAENIPLEGKKCYECYHDKKEVCSSCPAIRCFKSGNTEVEIVPGLESSPAKWVEVFCYPIKDEKSGKVIQVAEFVRDITERKKVEAALAESEEKLKEAQRLAKIGNWHWDIINDSTTWSDELCKINGHNKDLPVPYLKQAYKPHVCYKVGCTRNAFQ